MKRQIVLFLLAAIATTAKAQSFTLETVNDTLHYLVLRDSIYYDRWRITFPVYRMCEGDVDGDGSTDALVGVVKSTRFDKNVARRLFIFKNFHGHIRAMWMGSQLGGILQDFRFAHGNVVTLQCDTSGKYAVLEHEWRGFGLGAKQFLDRGVTEQEARKCFNEQ